MRNDNYHPGDAYFHSAGDPGELTQQPAAVPVQPVPIQPAAVPVQPPRTPSARPAAKGGFSVEKMRRVHNGESAAAPEVYADAPVFEDYAPACEDYPQANTAYPVYEDYASAPGCGEYYDAYAQEAAPPPKKKKKRTGLKVVLWIVIGLLVLALLTVAFIWFLQKMPQTSQPIGTRKKDCCTVLLAGTDESGMRTDTLMVMFIDRANKSIRLLSIPRDTMVNRDNPVPKINGAYYANGAEEVGMDYLMDYVKDLIGYRPDGYVLIDLNCFEELVDHMGGVDFNVPMDMHYEDPTQDLYIDLKAGQQHLNGKQAMWLVRFRSGYAAADLERVNVQRDFLKAALSQWKSPGKLIHVFGALKILSENTLTDMKWTNFTWLGMSAILCGTDSLESDTLPGTGEWVNGGAYYVEDREAAAALINEKYNPYEKEITADDLHPYGY